MENLLKIWAMMALVLSVACSVSEEEKTTEAKIILLAEAYNQHLYLSELDGMIPENMSASDSVAIINAYVERWIRKTLLMHEAEKHIPKDLNIDKLVRDYRASLVRHTYEQQLVEEQMDSVITKRALNEYYEKNQDQYQLETPIIRCSYVKIKQTAPDLKELRILWQSDSIVDKYKLLEYCNTHADVYLLADSIWYKVEDMATRLPKGTINSENINSRKEISLSDNDFLYLFKVHEIINRKEIAPLSFIEDQASKVILHRRKLKLLEVHREELYDLEMEKSNVKVFPFQVYSSKN